MKNRGERAFELEKIRLEKEVVVERIYEEHQSACTLQRKQIPRP